jgi:hypothetical protein
MNVTDNMGRSWKYRMAPERCGVVNYCDSLADLAVIFTGGKANCFDSQLWGAIKNRVNQDAQLWLKKSDDGKYTNIVGVRLPSSPRVWA